jgi:O-antigen ligase
MNETDRESQRASLKTLYLRSCFGAALALPALWFISEGAADITQKALIALFFAGISAGFLRIKFDFLTGAALLFCLAVLGSYIWHRYSVPHDLFGGSGARKYIYFFVFFIVLSHVFCAASRMAPHALLVSAGLGLAVHLALRVPLGDWSLALNGNRINFGFRNAQHAGVIFGTLLLACLLFFPRLLRSTPHAHRLWIVLAYLAYSLILLFGVIASQVRAVWLGLGVAALVLLTLEIRGWLRNGIEKRRAMVAGTLIIFITIPTVALVSDVVIRRLSSEAISAQSLQAAARFDSRHMTSSGIRIASWVSALEWSAERPLLGWGQSTVSALIKQSPHFDDRFKKNFGHLHNSYLELVVAIGAIGTGMAVLIIFVLLRMLVRLRREGHLARDNGSFILGFSVFWAISNMFESYVNYSSGLLINTLFGSFAYSTWINARTSSESVS